MTRRKLRIVFAASEATPFSKTGGLGDVAGSLPQALVTAGVKVSVILPLYGSVAASYRSQMVDVATLNVPLSWRNCYCGVKKLVVGHITYYFLDNEGYFRRDGLYGHFDDGERFAFFAKAICETIAQVDELEADILHCNDWQTALAPVFLREHYQHIEKCRAVKTVMTVHNIKFQGQYSDVLLDEVLGLGSIPAAAQQLRINDHAINFMKGGLCYADWLTTVSPSYAYELQTPYYGEGLDGIFRMRAACLSGMLNGIDLQEWDPASDGAIADTYTVDDRSGKATCKAALQQELGLAVDASRPLVVMIGRLTHQKGVGLLTYALPYLMERGIQVAVLGTGDRDIEDTLRYFDNRYGKQFVARITFDLELSHRMYAGGDILLMPSEFEPCGLSQMIAMRYGTLPVVRETGGLKDSVVPYNQFTGEGTGFSFANINADEMASVLCSACELFWTNTSAWEQLQTQAMTADVSWAGAAEDYVDVYHRLRPDITRYTRRHR